MKGESWAWVALALVPEIGWNAQRYHDLLGLGPPAEVFRTPVSELGRVVGREAARAVSTFDLEGAVEGQRRAAGLSGARLLTLADADYPAVLRAIPLPPPFLFLRGGLVREDALAVAVVGSRRPSAYGLRMAERLASDLAERGVTIVSGLARGVDTAAHQGALAGAGRTVAVLGSGLDVVYPPENARLAATIEGAGAVVSQFPMGTAPLPQHFPLRNRLIAALTVGTVVVEAAARSGALITARLAGELGREVYAVPGNVLSPVSEGTNGLIQDGAKLVRGWADVVAEWPAVWRQALRPVSPDAPQSTEARGTAEEERLLRLVGNDPVEIDDVIAQSGLSSSQVAAGLMTLAIRGLVRQLPGQRYVRG
jgi:DNA processing protein